MAVDPNSGASWSWELFSAGVAVLMGAFGYTMKRISDVETELKADQGEEVRTLRSELGKMEKSINDRFQEGRDDRNEMWRTIRQMQEQAATQHSQNLERIGRLPTRDEMMQMLERLAGRSTH